MQERDYVLGTDEAEIERLDLQHRVWREKALAAWRRAGIRPGQIVLDVGAGPGCATVDLAGLVGAKGRVIAIERSERFVAALEDRARRLGLVQVEARVQDVCEAEIDASADAAWCRWVLSFVHDPARTVRHIADALRPGGVAIFHEYADYGTWRTMPPDPRVERFRAAAMKSWRDAGGEPDVALALPEMIETAALELVEARPLIDIIGPQDFAWRWPVAFMASNAPRLAAMGYVGESEAAAMAHALEDAPPDTRMITPLVAELIARKPR